MMEYASPSVRISETFIEVRNFSFKKKTDEEIVNHFLDRILELQSKIEKDAIFLENLCERFDELTWFNASNLDEESLKLLNDTFSGTREIHRVLIKHYDFLNKNAHQFASKELKRLKHALDEIEECVDDLEATFFRLPQHEKFQGANARLQSL